MMQALLIFFCFRLFFLCGSFIFALTFHFSFLSKMLQNQDTIQTNQQISY
jgi:hypothetical protein